MLVVGTPRWKRRKAVALLVGRGSIGVHVGLFRASSFSCATWFAAASWVASGFVSAVETVEGFAC